MSSLVIQEYMMKSNYQGQREREKHGKTSIKVMVYVPTRESTYLVSSNNYRFFQIKQLLRTESILINHGYIWYKI